MAPRKSASPTTPPADGDAQQRAKAQRTPRDREAIERDYRTGKFSDGELGTKYGVSRQAISKMARANGWIKDLSAEVRHATRAAVIRGEVDRRLQAATGPATGPATTATEGEASAATGSATKAATGNLAGNQSGNLTRNQQQVAEGCRAATEATTDVVLAAAELNRQVIMQHRGDLGRARDTAMALLTELTDAALLQQHRELLAEIMAGEGATVADVALAKEAVKRALSLGSRVSSVKALAEALTKLQAAERVAFALDEKDEDDGNVSPVAAAIGEFLTGLHGGAGRVGFAEARKP